MEAENGIHGVKANSHLIPAQFSGTSMCLLVPPREFSQSLVPGGILYVHSGFKPVFTCSVLHESND